MPRDYAKQSSRNRGKNARGRGRKKQSSVKLYVVTGGVLLLFIAGLAYLNKHKPNPQITPASKTEVATTQKAESTKPETASSTSTHHTSHHKTKKSNTKVTKEQTTPQFEFYTILPKMKVWLPKDQANQTGQSGQSGQNSKSTGVTPPSIDADDKLAKTETKQNSTPATDTNAAKEKIDEADKMTDEMADTAMGATEAKAAPDSNANANANTNTTSDSQDNTTTQTAQAAPTTPTAPTTATETRKQYFLQVASFASYDDADRSKAQLSLLGYDVTIKSVKNKAKNVYRVSVGPYSTLASATKAQLELTAAHVNTMLVTM